MIPYHKLLQHTRWEANPNDLCIVALTNPRAAFLKLSSASTRERLSVESCMLRMCRQHTDLRGSGPILFSCKKTTNFCQAAAAFIASAQRRVGLQPKQPRKLYHGNRAPLRISMRLLSHRLTAALRLLGFSEILASSFGSRVELLPFVNNKIPELLTSFDHV